MPAGAGPVFRPESLDSRHGLVATLGAVGIGGGDDQPVFPSVTLGRRPRVSITDTVEEIRVPDLLLRGRLEAKSLNEGLNTLTVVVSNGSGADRLTQSVVFHWSPAAATKFPGAPFRPALGALPGRLDIGGDLLAPALAAVAGTGAAKRSIRGKPLPVAKSVAPRHFRNRDSLAQAARAARERLAAAPEFTRALGKGEAERLRAGRLAIEPEGVALRAEAETPVKTPTTEPAAARAVRGGKSNRGRIQKKPPAEAS